MSMLDTFPPTAKPATIPGLSDAPLSPNPLVAAHQQAAQNFAIQQQNAIPGLNDETMAKQGIDPTGMDAGTRIKQFAASRAAGIEARKKAEAPDPYVAYENLDPQEQAMVDQIAAYQVPFPTRGGFKPEKLLRLKGALASKYGPDSPTPYNAAEYLARQTARVGFASGPEAKSKTAINTVIDHLKGLNDSVDNLGNSNVLPGVTNYVANTVGNIASADKQAKLVDFNAKANAVASELTKVFTGNVPAMQQIKEWRATLDPNMSPQAQKQAIDSAIGLLGSRMSALQDQWDSGVKTPRDIPFLSKQSRAILEELQKKGATNVSHLALDPVVNESPSAPPVQPKASVTLTPPATSAAGGTATHPVAQQPNITQAEHARLKPGETFWWNGRQLTKQ